MNLCDFTFKLDFFKYKKKRESVICVVLDFAVFSRRRRRRRNLALSSILEKREGRKKGRGK